MVEIAFFRLVVRFVYLFMVGLGLAALAAGTIIVICRFGCLCLSSGRLLGGILSLK
jgi:hypothetical protein